MELLDTRETNIIPLKTENLEEFLVLKCLAQCCGTIREDTVVREPELLDVLCSLEHFSDVACTIRPNHIITEVELSKGGVMLDVFANGNAAVDTCLVVGHIQH